METIAEHVLLSIAYHAPVQYYSKIYRYSHVYIEQYETYQKQSYRNRCHILSANGILPLTVPIIHKGEKIPIKDVRIDYSKRWIPMHLRAIEAAYRSSPYYLYYIDDIKAVYEKKFAYLWDMNMAFIELTLGLLNVNSSLKTTSNYKKIPSPYDDFSQIIHPKEKYQQPDPAFCPRPYYQVFEHKFGFIPNLSILDLVFNTGPEAIQWL